jgi:ABC-type transport system substrate-binding protein
LNISANRKFVVDAHRLKVILLLLLIFILSCSEKSDDHFLKIGLPEEPRTLNIWLASDANSKKILSLIYQPLYLRDPDTLTLIPWLAEGEPEFDPETISYTVRLKPANWSDGSEVTSEDVAFTGYLIKEFRVPQYFSRWKFIEKIEAPDKHTVRFYLKEPQAIFLTRTLTTSIVQKKEWIQITQKAKEQQKPLKFLLNYRLEHPVGCGPFVLEEWRRGTYLHLRKNKYFFGSRQQISGRLLGPFVDDILFKINGTHDAFIQALKKGSIDMLWQGIQPRYIGDLSQQPRDVRLFFSGKSSVYFMGFNVRQPPFNDVSLRRAAAFLIDKEYIVSQILRGHGTRMDSIVPAENRYWFSPKVPRYGKGLTREDRIKKAYQILHQAGYSWMKPPVDKNGKVVQGRGIRLPDGRRMKKITILIPPGNYDPHRAISGTMIQKWFREMGVEVYTRSMDFGSLLEQVKGRHEFDAFILGYGKLSLDPDYLRNFFHSANDKHQGWNMSGYKNPGFDRIAAKSSSEMNSDRRKNLIWKMQEIIMTDVPYIPIYNPSLIEAVRTDKFSGWVKTLG